MFLLALGFLHRAPTYWMTECLNALSFYGAQSSGASHRSGHVLRAPATVMVALGLLSLSKNLTAAFPGGRCSHEHY